MTKAQIHTPPETSFLNKQNFRQITNTELYKDTLSSQNQNIYLSENQDTANQQF